MVPSTAANIDKRHSMPSPRALSRRQKLRNATKPRQEELPPPPAPPPIDSYRSAFFRKSTFLILLSFGCLIGCNQLLNQAKNARSLSLTEPFLPLTTTTPAHEHQTTQKTETTILSNHNRTLVVVMGNFRGGEQAWTTLAKNVLDPSMADLALLLPEQDGIARNSSLFSRAKYVWTFPDYDDWGDAVDLISGPQWRHELLEFQKGRNPSIFGGVKGESGSGAIIMMQRWFLQNHIRGNDLTERYDRFVITRSDHYYQCEHDVTTLDVGNKILWIPEGQDNFSGPGRMKILGFTDRHLIVGSDDVLDALDVYPTYFRTRWMKKRRNIWNTENLLKLAWRQYGMKVRHFPRVMFTCAVETDTSTWGQANKPAPGLPGLFLKYPLEFRRTQNTCLANLPK